MIPSERRLLILALALLGAALLMMTFGGCRGPDVFGVGAGFGRGDGGISGPLSPGGPPGPKAPSSGDWDTDSEAWQVGAWVTWDLNPRRVEIVNYPPPPSWRAEIIVPVPTKPDPEPESEPAEAALSDVEPTPLPKEPPKSEAPLGPSGTPYEGPADSVVVPATEEGGPPVGEVWKKADGVLGGKEALGIAGLALLLVQYWPQILVWGLKLVRKSPPEVSP